MSDAVSRQRMYYEATAETYDSEHGEREHVVALHLLAAYIQLNGIRGVLDVAAGTGRAMRFLKTLFPRSDHKGVQPVEALRLQGHANSISEVDLVAGDGATLPFTDKSFDLEQVAKLFEFLRLWPLANWVKTRGKGYTYSESDGVAYSYSVFQSLRQIKREWG